MTVNITISPDSKDSNNIQNALAEIEKAGSGKLLLKRGVHFSNPLRLVNNLDFTLEEGCRLIITDNPVDFPLVWTRWEGTECYAIQPMVFAENCCHINISGKGTIDGQGEKWWNWYHNIRDGGNPAAIETIREKLSDLNKDIKAGSGGGGIGTNFLRPALVQFKNCRQVNIKDICVQNSAFWNTHILYSSEVLIHDVHFKNPEDSPNTDGLDIDSSNNVIVSNCLFDVGDDCICVKSGMDEDGRRVGIPSSSIKIQDCTMKKGHGGVVFGSESAGGISNVKVKNCKMNGTDRGIRFKTRRGRGGTIQNVVIDSVTMNNVLCPISVNMFYRCGLTTEELTKLSTTKLLAIDHTTPAIRNIKISNIKARDVKAAAGYFCGLPEQPVTNIYLENINIMVADGSKQYEPAMDMFHTKVNKTGFLHRFTENIHFKDIIITDQLGNQLPCNVGF